MEAEELWGSSRSGGHCTIHQRAAAVSLGSRRFVWLCCPLGCASGCHHTAEQAREKTFLSSRRRPFWNVDILKGSAIPGVVYLAAVPEQRLQNCKPSACLLELLSNHIFLPVSCGASWDFSTRDGSLGVI